MWNSFNFGLSTPPNIKIKPFMLWNRSDHKYWVTANPKIRRDSNCWTCVPDRISGNWGLGIWKRMKIGYKPNLWHLMKLIDRNGLTDLVERTGHRGDRIMNIIMVMSLFHCPMCASPASLEEFMVSETMFRKGHIATYAQCLRCNSLVRTSVLPPQSLLYPDNYYSLSRDAESALSGPMRHWLCTRLAKSTFS